ncbi:MAG TPA: phosphatidate cytidylyltransferase [Chitinophagaceae bacterium]
MAFNLATFKTRALTAVIFVIVMVLGVVASQWSFFILFSIIHFGCWMEYQKLVLLIDKEYAFITPFHKFGVMIAGWSIMLLFARAEYPNALEETGVWLGLLAFVGLVIEAIINKRKDRKYLAHSFFGLVYISLSLALFINLPSLYNGMDFSRSLYNWNLNRWGLPAFVIACMWINDTMAYIVGSFIGKTPLSKISPKKTWEGTVGGILLCAVVAGLLAYNLLVQFHEWGLLISMVIAAIAAIAGTFGDLLESKLKRLAMVKDSGQIMPGHGGFLDRFDSLLLAGPVVWLVVSALNYFMSA